MRYFTIVFVFLMLNSFGNNSIQAQDIKSKKIIKLSGSVKYIIAQENAKNALIKTGDFISFHIIVKNSKDSILGSSVESGIPALQEVMTKGKSGGFEDVLLKLHKGDSAIVWVNSDSLAKQSGRPLPTFIAKGSDLKYAIKIIDIMDKAQSEALAEKIKEQQKADYEKKTEESVMTDEKIIREYITKNNLKAENIGNGIYYVRIRDGSGAYPQKGDTIFAHYTGKTIEGKIFDSSLTTRKAFEFKVGTGMVIAGWDEGFLKMKKREKGILIIPSAMAYSGQSPVPDIKPFSVLVFEVELLKIVSKK